MCREQGWDQEGSWGQYDRQAAQGCTNILLNRAPESCPGRWQRESNEPLHNGLLFWHNTQHQASEMGLYLQRKIVPGLTQQEPWCLVNRPRDNLSVAPCPPAPRSPRKGKTEAEKKKQVWGTGWQHLFPKDVCGNLRKSLQMWNNHSLLSNLHTKASAS